MVAQPYTSTPDRADLWSVDDLASRRLAPGRAARAASLLFAARLDRRLAAGVDPRDSTLLAARAASLTSRCGRRRLAAAVEGAVDKAQGPRRRWWSVLPTDPIDANAQTLLGLVSLLESERPLYARGIAALWGLITDGTGPFYGSHPGGLGLVLRDVRDAMTGAPAAP
jgi:hypothetical protein